MWAFSSCGEQGLLSSCNVWASLVAVAPLIVEHGLEGTWTSGVALHELRVVACRLLGVWAE